MSLRLQAALGVVAASLASTFAAGAGAQTATVESRRASVPASPLAAIERPRLAPGAGGPDGPEAGYGLRAGEYSRLELDELMTASGTPGLAIAVFHDFEIVWTHERGVADLETGRKVDGDTLFQAASISKPVGAAAVLRAVDDGLFTLDTPINHILKRWRLPENAFTVGRPVTPRLLLSHTAGTTMPGFPGYSPRAAIPTALEVLDEAGPSNTAAVRVDTRPGTTYRYSGGGTTVLQVALADATGRAFREVLQDWVLGPAGMADSGFDQPMRGARAERAARAHHRPDSEALGEALAATAVVHPHAVRGRDPWHVYPELQAAGLWTTPSDLARFAIEIARAVRGDDGRILSPALAREMTTESAIGDDGLGFAMQDRGSDDRPLWYFSHSGGNWGFRCYLVAAREGGYGAALMANGDDFEILLEVVRRIAQAWNWEGNFTVRPRNWD